MAPSATEITLNRSRSFLVAALALHLLLVTAIGAREIFWVLSRAQTVFPASWKREWIVAEKETSRLLLEKLRPEHPLRQGIATYINLAGIESGYGFFAPNVSDSCKLGFELHYPDGRIEYRLPSVSSHAAGLRLATFLDKLGRPDYDLFREEMMRDLTISVWREHSDAVRIRAVLGLVILPTMSEYEHHIGERNEILYGYDFGFAPAEDASEN